MSKQLAPADPKGLNSAIELRLQNQLARAFRESFGAEQGLRVRVNDLSMQDADHPWILQMPMTRYLMTWWVQRDG